MKDIAELESRIAFLDDAMQALTLTVTRQDNRLRELENEIIALRRQLLNAQSQVADLRDESPPPHY